MWICDPNQLVIVMIEQIEVNAMWSSDSHLWFSTRSLGYDLVRLNHKIEILHSNEYGICTYKQQNFSLGFFHFA